MVVTLPERKAQTIQRLELAAAATKAALASYAREHHGRFVLFGSFARGNIRPDSDIDIMVDFEAPDIMVDFEAPDDRTARDAAETICRAHGLVPDVHLKSEVAPSLMRRILRDGVHLP